MKQIAQIQGSPPTIKILPSCLGYMIWSLSIYLGAVHEAANIVNAISRGFIVGFLLNGYYLVLNMALFKLFDYWNFLIMAAIGTFFGGVVAPIGFYFRKKRFQRAAGYVGLQSL